MKSSLLVLCAFTAAFLCARAPASEVTVYAASSLEAPLREYSARFQKETGHKMKFVFGRSDELLRSIKGGAPGDVFFSASNELIDQAESAEKLIAGTRYTLISNFLVIAVPQGDIGNPPTATVDLADPQLKKLGLFKTESAPAGVYAREYLEKAKLWDQVKDKVVPFENAKALFEALDKRDVDAAIVFKTDALISQTARVTLQIPRDQTPSISYSLAALAGSTQPELATLAVTYLCKPEAMEIYGKYGFTSKDIGSGR